MKTIQKYAYIPTMVNTWRNTKAIVWLQPYYIKINYEQECKYCLSLRLFSIEF